VQSPLLAEISALFSQLETPVEVQQTAITKRGGTKLEDLTEEAAKNLLDGLRSIAVGKSPVAPVSTVTPATEANKPAGPKMITGEQQDRIRKLFNELQVPAEARVAAYQKRGASALAELTESGANDLIHKLVGMSTGLDQLSAMQMPVNDVIDLPDGTKKTVQCADGSVPFDPTPVASGAA
jgi:sulfur relay (sulfurtransferase) complex TusBCD TusD component (DsrE family)